MQIVTVILLKRKIPEGSLSYISTIKIPIGSIIIVPLKNKDEFGLVINCVSAIKEKSLLKSLPYSLKKINNPKIINKIDRVFLNSLIKFSDYALCDLDKIIRSIFKSYDSKKIKENKFSNLIITSKIDFINKDLYPKDQIVSYSEFINSFLNNNIKNLEIYNPEDLSEYGLAFLGYDPVILLLNLAKSLKIQISFTSKLPRLRYNEWNIKNTYNDTKEKLEIISREDSNFSSKSNALDQAIIKIIKSNLNQNKKILILTSKTGFASKTICNDCNTTHNCINVVENNICGGQLFLIKNNKNLAKIHGIAGDYIYICKKCNHAENSIAKCRNCNSWNLLALGYGKEKIIENLFQYTNIKKTELFDSTERISLRDLKNWDTNGGVNLISYSTLGDITNADIIIVPSINSLLYGQNFESIERIFYLIKSSKLANDKMYIITQKNDEAEYLNQDYKKWSKNELIERKNAPYPPYCRYIEISLGLYISKNTKISNFLISELEKISIPKTCGMYSTFLGNNTIYTCFDIKNYSLLKDNLELTQKIKHIIQPFKNYLQIKVY